MMKPKMIKVNEETHHLAKVQAAKACMTLADYMEKLIKAQEPLVTTEDIVADMKQRS